MAKIDEYRPIAGAHSVDNLSLSLLTILPTYNERENLPELIRRLRALPIDPHVLVVDDASPDGTGALADSLAAADPGVHVLHRPGKLGLGTAYLAGFQWALGRGYPIVATMDADFSHPPEDLPRLAERAAAGFDADRENGLAPGADVVIGSRYVPGGGTAGCTWARRLISRGANWLARSALGIGVHDATAGYRVYRREALLALPLEKIFSNGYSFLIETAFYAERLGLRVVEEPITFVNRVDGKSKISRGEIVRAMETVGRLVVGGRVLKRRTALAIAGGLVLSLLATALAEASRPTQAASWSAPEVVWQSGRLTASPVLVTDAADRTHLFFVDTDERTGTSILYHTLADGGDFDPVDVLIGIGDYRVKADPFGRLHLIYRGDGDTLWYTTVPADLAHDPRAWSPAAVIATATTGSDIAADNAGNLYACMPAQGGVGLIRSGDGGRTWSASVAAAITADDAAIATYVRCTVAKGDGIHIAWAEASPPNYYPADGMFYTHSVDAGKSWSPPEQMAGQHYTWPSLVSDNAGGIHLLWQGDVAVGGRFYRYKEAGSDEWSAVERPIPDMQGGLSGDAPLAIDGSGRANLLTAANGIMWTTRTPSGWSSSIDVAAAQAALPNASGSIEYPALAISRGNTMHAAWEFDFKTIYYASAALAVDETIGVPAPLPATWATAVPFALADAGAGSSDAGETDPIAGSAGPTGNSPSPAVLDRSTPPLVAPDERYILAGPAVALVVVIAALGLVCRRGRVG